MQEGWYRVLKMDRKCSKLLHSISFVIAVSMVIVSSNGVLASPQVPAMFVFGDSLTDNGNNNFLNSLAKANYVPYGIDFFGPTGRFCNGKTIIDFLGELLELPYLPPYTLTSIIGRNILNGVNYASAAAGILDETGKNLGGRFSLRQQVQNFQNTLNQLKNQMEGKDLSQYLAKSLVVVILGSNDYINNYLLPGFYSTSRDYNPKDYADYLIDHYTKHILELHGLGLRKFFLAGVGPLGCIPNQLANGAAPSGKCICSVNDIVRLFNDKLKSLVDWLSANYQGATFVYGDTYGVFIDILTKSSNYGFEVRDKGCCGIGRNAGDITCLPFSVPCFNRDKYVFWDAFHPSQAANKIIAQKAYSGSPPDCYPMNVKQMVQL